MSFLASIKSLGKDMSIYGVSKLLSQLISFFLLPLYTTYLAPEDYGVLAMVGFFIGSYVIVANFGIHSAIFRFTGMAKDDKEIQVYLDNAQILNIVFNIFFFIVFFIFIDILSLILFNQEGYEKYLKIGLISGGVGSLASIPLSYLRVIRKINKIAVSSLINLIISVLCTFVALIVLEWGIIGALLGNLSGSLVAMIYLFSNVKFPDIFQLSKVRIWEIMKYAIPMLPHKAFGFAIPIVSQALLVRFASLQDLGLYNVTYKVCMPLVLFTNLFQKAYSPFRFEILRSGDSNSKKTFRKFNLLYICLILFCYTGITLVGPFIVEIMTNEAFHQASIYIPFIALIPIAQAFYFIFGTGVEFAKSPVYMPLISLSGLITVVFLSYVLIPEFGIYGAGISSSMGWITMAVVVFFYSQSIYAIQYSWIWIVAVLLVTFILQVIVIYNPNYRFNIILIFIFSCGILLFSVYKNNSRIKNYFLN